MESTDIKVKLNSVEQVRQFVETMRKYDGDVDVYSTNRNYLVDGKQINIGHNLSGATAGTYGDGTHVSKVVVDEAGHVTSAEQVAIDFSEVTVPVYDIVKDTDSGDYAAIYHLTKDGVNTGAAINIPKDLFVKSGEVVDNPTGQ